MSGREISLKNDNYLIGYIHLIHNKIALRDLSKTEIYIRFSPIHKIMIRAYYLSRVYLYELLVSFPKGKMIYKIYLSLHTMHALI